MPGKNLPETFGSYLASSLLYRIATEMDLRGCIPCVEEETKAKEKIHRIEEAEKRIQQTKEQAQRELERLEKKLPEALLSWTLNKKRKYFLDHKGKIAETKELINDCEQALKTLHEQARFCRATIAKAEKFLRPA